MSKTSPRLLAQTGRDPASKQGVLPVVTGFEAHRPEGQDSMVKNQSGPGSAVEPCMDQEELVQLLRQMRVKDSHIRIALARQEATGESLQVIMRDFGFISAECLAQVLARYHRMDYFPASGVDGIDVAGLGHLDTEDLMHYVPVGYNAQHRLEVAISDPEDATAARNRYHRDSPVLVMASPNTIQAVYRSCFADTEEVFDRLVATYTEAQSGRCVEDYPNLIQDILGGLIRHACYAGASDVYLNYSDLVGIIRLKVNDVGSLFRTLDRRLMDRLLTKLIGERSNAEALRREPQEGLFDFTEEEKGRYPDLVHRYMFRMELMETRGKQQAVIRILDRQSTEVEFEHLGFSLPTARMLKRCIQMPGGIIAVTGPTGCGKTTTQYALLQLIDPVERSIQTIENPVEYRHGLWLQHEPVQDEACEGLGARKTLNALLRSAPSVILFGEVRRD
ncbi:MAG: Flp pilus assembly complex ATPase component TadA, partial [Pseudomonadota bacterium]|nr:Flp pilus assembly complex ATPase component TadA [Pseudomonadota bacterium]